MDCLDPAIDFWAVSLAIDQARPDEVAFGNHCCEGDVIFRSCTLYAADDGETGAA